MDGYTWLLLTELINMDENPEKVMDYLQRYYNCNKTSGFPAPVTASDAMFSYAIANDLDVPRVYTSNRTWLNIMISELLLPIPGLVNEDIMDKITGYPFENYYNEAARGIDPIELFNASLPKVDELMRETTDKGILDTYGEERTEKIELFAPGHRDAPVFFRDLSCIVTYTSPNESLTTFLGAMARYCQKVLEKSEGVGNGPSVSSVFTKEYRKVVDHVFNRGNIIKPCREGMIGRGSIRDYDVKTIVTPTVMSSDKFSRHTLSKTSSRI